MLPSNIRSSLVLTVLAGFILSCNAANSLVRNPLRTPIDINLDVSTLNRTPSPREVLQPGLLLGREKEYEVVQYLRIVNHGPGEVARVELTVAQIQDYGAYQQVLFAEEIPASETFKTDSYGNVYSFFKLGSIGEEEEILVEMHYTVRVMEVHSVLGNCRGEIPKTDIASELFIESDAPEIIQKANELGRGANDPCEQIRSYYDYVADTLTYGGYQPGDVGALQAFLSGQGDCTEFADLLLALSRAGGIPARFLEGVTCCTASGYVQGQNKHDWLEVYLPGVEWAPMDPTHGRQVLSRDAYFAAMPPDRIIVTQGRNLDMLHGGHFYYYEIYYEDQRPNVNLTEEWSILAR